MADSVAGTILALERPALGRSCAGDPRGFVRISGPGVIAGRAPSRAPDPPIGPKPDEGVRRGGPPHVVYFDPSARDPGAAA